MFDLYLTTNSQYHVGHYVCDRMVIRFTPTSEIGVYHLLSCDLDYLPW